MGAFTLKVNGQLHEVVSDSKTPLLWVLRDTLGLTGTKYGCGIGQCGSCTVHLNDLPVRSCTIPIEEAADGAITTIEGLAAQGGHSLQQAWLEVQVPQCGYCQPGQIMQAAALLKANPAPNRAEIASSMAGVLCRCGTYQRILAAIETVVASGGGI